MGKGRYSEDRIRVVKIYIVDFTKNDTLANKNKNLRVDVCVKIYMDF